MSKYSFAIGVTLVELMVTLAVVAIALTLAVPPYLNFIEKRQVERGANDLANFIEMARSLAVRNNETVSFGGKPKALVMVMIFAWTFLPRLKTCLVTAKKPLPLNPTIVL